MLKIYNKLFAENIDSIYLKSSNNSINIDNIRKFVDNQCHSKAKEFAKFVVNNITYVNFDTFLSRIRLLTQDLVSSLNDSKLVFVIPQLLLYKSNFWVSLLLNAELKKLNIEIHDVIDNYNEYLRTAPVDNYLFVFMDDCAYSGRQLVIDMMAEKNNKFDKNKYKLFIFVPYVSYSASALFSARTQTLNVIYPPSIIYFDNFWQACKKKGFNPLAYDLFYSDITDEELRNNKEVPLRSMIFNFYRFFHPTSLIYFDHKIADAVSIAQCLLNYGPIFNKYKILKHTKTFDQKLKESISAFEEANTLDEIKNVILKYIQDVLTVKEGDKLLSQLVNDTNYFSLESCYNPKAINEYKINEDYFPLITTEGECNPKYYGCIDDLNKYEDAMCLKTFYKKINYLYNGKSIREITGKPIDEISLDLLIEYTGGYISSIIQTVNKSNILIIVIVLLILLLFIYFTSAWFTSTKTNENTQPIVKV